MNDVTMSRAPRPAAAVAGPAALLSLLAACGPAPLGTLQPVSDYRDAAALTSVLQAHRVPLVVIGSTVYLPSAECAEPSDRLLGGAREARRVGGQDEDRALAADGESRERGGAAENRAVAGEGESRQVGGAREGRQVAGEGEARASAGAAERRSLAGEGEQRLSAGGAEQRATAGAAEERPLVGAVQSLRCRRDGDSAFLIVNHERLSPKVFLGDRLEDVVNGYVRF